MATIPSTSVVSAKADRNLDAANPDVDRELVFLIVALEAQHQHAQRIQKEAPDHAERISFAQQVNVAAAQHDGDDLQHRDQVDDPESGAELLMRLAEPVHQHAVFGHAVHHAVGADHRSIHGARQNQHAHDHHKDMKHQPQHLRPGQIHRQSAQQIVRSTCRTASGDNHAREHGDHAGANHRVEADDIPRNASGSSASDRRSRDTPAPASRSRSWRAANARTR